MKKFFAVLSLIIVSAFSGNAQKKQAKVIKPPYQTVVIENSPVLQTLLKKAVGDTLNSYAAKGVKVDEVAATLVDLRNPDNLTLANYRGDAKHQHPCQQNRKHLMAKFLCSTQPFTFHLLGKKGHEGRIERAFRKQSAKHVWNALRHKKSFGNKPCAQGKGHKLIAHKPKHATYRGIAANS